MAQAPVLKGRQTRETHAGVFNRSFMCHVPLDLSEETKSKEMGFGRNNLHPLSQLLWILVFCLSGVRGIP